MSVNPTLLTSGKNDSNLTSYATASISPPANRWLVVDVNNSVPPGTAPVPAVSGLGLTFIEEKSRAIGRHRLTRFYAWTGAAPGSGALTIDTDVVTQEHCGWIVSYLGADAATDDPFVQSESEASSGSTLGIEVALAAFASPDNRPFIFVEHGQNNSVSTPEAGYTEIATEIGTSSGVGYRFSAAFHPSSADTSPSYSWATANNNSLAIASEIKAAVVAGGRPPGGLMRMGVG